MLGVAVADRRRSRPRWLSTRRPDGRATVRRWCPRRWIGRVRCGRTATCPQPRPLPAAGPGPRPGAAADAPYRSRAGDRRPAACGGPAADVRPGSGRGGVSRRQRQSLRLASRTGPTRSPRVCRPRWRSTGSTRPGSFLRSPIRRPANRPTQTVRIASSGSTGRKSTPKDPNPGPDGPAGPIGEVYVLGVDPAAGIRGLGTPLTAAGLDYLAGRGLDTVMLYVEGDNDRARRLYERFGFNTVLTNAVYSRPAAPTQ